MKNIKEVNISVEINSVPFFICKESIFLKNQIEVNVLK